MAEVERRPTETVSGDAELTETPRSRQMASVAAVAADPMSAMRRALDHGLRPANSS